LIDSLKSYVRRTENELCDTGLTTAPEKGDEALFPGELMGKNIALVVMIDYDTRMVFVHSS
jgi:hypothetical protein